jgi:hypothetical protein
MDIIIKCPHCDGTILINVKDLNCMIFRHAIFKETNNQINPHSSQIECENYINNNKIYGCGKPFKVLIVDLTYISEICDYI